MTEDRFFHIPANISDGINDNKYRGKDKMETNKLLIGNGILVTRDEKNTFLPDGAVYIEGEKIAAIGKTEELKERYSDAEYLDAKGMLIMPGYLNLHEHIYSAFARGLSIPGEAPKEFLGILEHTWWNIDRHLLLEQTFYSAMMTYIESIRNGVTFINDHHASYAAIPESLFEIAKAAETLGIRTCLAYEISDRDGKKKRDEAIEESMRFLSYVQEKNSPMLKGMIGLHASFTLSDETLALCRKENTFHAGYHVHIAEGQYDEDHCQKTYGMSVVERFAKEGILGENTIAGHCIHVSESDLDLLKKTNTTVIHNPESNMGNAVGAPDIIKMLDKGILVGLGTDGYTQDMTESLKVANILQKHVRKFADRGFSEACELLFENNATIASKITGETIGMLKPGAMADMILVNYVPYTPLTAENINGHLMFGVTGAMTDTTIINGKVLMKNRKLLSLNEDEIMEECRKAAAALWKSLR